MTSCRRNIRKLEKQQALSTSNPRLKPIIRSLELQCWELNLTLPGMSTKQPRCLTAMGDLPLSA